MCERQWGGGKDSGGVVCFLGTSNGHFIAPLRLHKEHKKKVPLVVERKECYFFFPLLAIGGISLIVTSGLSMSF
jgi:hypothetical protein